MINVAVLFARADSIYKSIDGCDVWDKERNALNWPGCVPAIFHPPCRAWSRMRHFSKPAAGEKDLALWAVDRVRENGGVLEHPAASSLWPAAGLPFPGQTDAFGGWTLPVSQYSFGHLAEKSTLLYIVGCRPSDIPILPFVLGRPTHTCLNSKGISKSNPGWRPEITRSQREQTPIEFAHWLVALARQCKVLPSHRCF